MRKMFIAKQKKKRKKYYIYIFLFIIYLIFKFLDSSTLKIQNQNFTKNLLKQTMNIEKESYLIKLAKNYILDNRENYVFSALSASIDGCFEFMPTANADVGVLEVDMDSTFLINDGQHRKAAIIQALNEDDSIGNETISVVFYTDMGLKRSQQMFTDLNKHAVKTSNSIAELYDSRDLLAVVTRKVISQNN